MASSDNEDEQLDDENVDGFDLMSPVGDSPLTRALSGRDLGLTSDGRSLRATKNKNRRESWQQVYPMLAEAVESGDATASVDASARDLGKKIEKGNVDESDLESYFNNLKITKDDWKRGTQKFKADAKTGWGLIVPKEKRSSVGDIAAGEEGASSEIQKSGTLYVDYRHIRMEGTVDLPQFLTTLLQTTKLDYYLIISRPSGAPSAGLHGYKEVTTRKERRWAPLIVVVDEPGMLTEDKFQDPKYIWMEIPLGDTFMLDITNMTSMADYLKVLTRSGKKNYKNKTKGFAKEANIEHEWKDEKFEVTDDFINLIWPLYKQTGEKNGYTVLTEEEFYAFHRTVPNLIFSLCWDRSDPMNKKLVSFCSGLTWKDVMMPMWCGTDYENPLNRTCTTYFIMLYNFVEYSIGKPHFNWVDLGMTQRKAKTAMGFSPYPCAGYFRCANTFVQLMVETMMEKYYDADKLMTDA